MSEEMDLDGSSSKRACDSCRTRKIRCNRSVPCSNCKASNLTCTTTAPVQKTVRQRVHISEEYEKKIDRIEDRLSGIENVLSRLASKLGDLDLQTDATERSSQSRPSRVGSRVGSGKSPTLATDATTPAPFEGETAINSQSGYARALLTKVVGDTPSIGQNAEIKSALSALGDIVKGQEHITVSTTSTTNSLINRALQDLDPGKLERPPWPAVKEMLERALKYPTMAFAVIFPFLKMRNLFEIFEDAYTNPSQCPAPRRILAYGVGYNLFTEFSALPWCNGLDQNALRGYATKCKYHLEVAISQLDVFIPASYENVMALVLGAACAIEMCKPSLAWVLTAMAAGQSQNLGYHRYQTFQNDEEEERNSKVHLFWMIYMFDKQLSLRLGRASVIQDWDMSLPLITSTPTPAAMALGASQMMAYWIKVAKVQGQTYEKLFSPAAFLKTPEERIRTSMNLIDAMNQAWYERGEASVMDFTPLTTGQDFSKRRKVAMASPNDTELPSKRKRFVQQPFGTSLPPEEYIQGSFERVEDAPFTPFIVVFCNAIQKSDTVDLDTLQRFVASLESCRTVSEGADKLYKMCHLFLQVAKLYIQAKKNDMRNQPRTVAQPAQNNFYTTTDGTQLDLSTMTQFDPYLSALGLVPNSAWPMAGYSDTPAMGTAMGSFANVANTANTQGSEVFGVGYASNGLPQNSVQDWFSGSRYLMNLMEAGDDMQMPDLNDFDVQL
ncbi:hypothetical protein N0V87_005925 [Didymella glomerata]|uniref:Zn(2)-C6 fungal-type domain-containing protein n=1 Tax=Didymella glomerata TaxID=749621 RepID=A0A9W8WXI0_9PLEO|nr:hypothetical protein N0V87_005925 [Didymella glomerata]